MPRELLVYLGEDFVKYFRSFFIINYLLLILVGLNTLRIYRDFRNKKSSNFEKSFSKYDLIVTLIVDGIELLSLYFVAMILGEYGFKVYLYQMMGILILAIAMTLVQFNLYRKTYGIIY